MSLLLTSLALVLAENPERTTTAHAIESEVSTWAAVRAELTAAAFGSAALSTKTRPDWVFDVSDPAAFGGQTAGRSGNTSVLIWTIADGGLALNATVFYSLNTSGSATADYPVSFEPLGPSQNAGQAPGNGDTGQTIVPRKITDTLVLYHNGHETHWTGEHFNEPLCVRPPLKTPSCWGCDPALHKNQEGFQAVKYSWEDPTKVAQCWMNYDTVLGWVNELGYDAMEFSMPLRGPNNNGKFGTMSHSWFEKWEKKGVHTMKFFVEPVILAINYAKTLGYKRIVMVGLSGGGWTTTVAAAIDPRIDLSIPVAGSLPFDMRTALPGDPFHDLGDYEQQRARPIYDACNYTCMYALAGLEAGRQQMQMLHEDDPCCFRAGGGRPNGHTAILQYNAAVQGQIQGYMCTAVTTGNVHEINLRGKTIIASALDQLDTGTLRLNETCYSQPFNILKRWKTDDVDGLPLQGH